MLESNLSCLLFHLFVMYILTTFFESVCSKSNPIVYVFCTLIHWVYSPGYFWKFYFMGLVVPIIIAVMEIFLKFNFFSVPYVRLWYFVILSFSTLFQLVSFTTLWMLHLLALKYLWYHNITAIVVIAIFFCSRQINFTEVYVWKSLIISKSAPCRTV